MNAWIERENNEQPMSPPPWKRARTAEAHAESKLPDANGTANRRPPTMPRANPIDWPPPSRPLTPLETNIRPLRSLEPDIVAEPRDIARQRSRNRSIVQFSMYFGLAALVSYGIIEMTASYGQRPVATAPRASDTSGAVSHNATTRLGIARIAVEDRQASIDEPLPLKIALQGAAGDEDIVLTGLAEGTRLSAGEPLGPTGWRLPVRDLRDVVTHAPPAFVGTVDVLVELRSPDNAPIDMQVARLEWVAKPSARSAEPKPETARPAGASAAAASQAQVALQVPPRPTPQTAPQAPLGEPVLPAAAPSVLPPERVTYLAKRGVEFLKDGNFAAARLMLRPAADAGNAQAALLLGATYDPIALAELGVYGLHPDPTAARAWYQRAQQFGAAEASVRIERMAHGR